MLTLSVITFTYIIIILCDKKIMNITIYSSIIIISLLLFSGMVTLPVIFVSFILSHIIISIFIYIKGKNREVKEVDTILVLGNALKEDEITPLLKYRLDTAIMLTKQYPQAKIIVSGGKIHDSTITEAKAMEDYLIKHGIRNTIIKEEQSKDTYENIVNSKVLINNDQPVMIITNRFHMYRSILLTKKIGYKNVGSKVAKTGVKTLYYYLYEIYAFYLFKRDGKL